MAYQAVWVSIGGIACSAVASINAFSGSHIVELLVRSPFKNVSFAIAGRNEAKLRDTLSKVSSRTSK